MYDQAVECLKALLQGHPGDASIAYQIGLLLAATNPPSSFSYLAQAAGIDKEVAPPAGQIQSTIRTAQLSDEPAYTFLAAGRSLADLGEWDLAEEAFTRAVEIRPDYPEAWAYLGEARQHVTSISATGMEPLTDLKRAYELDPASLSANLFLAFYYQRQNNHEKALEYLNDAARLEPKNPIIHTEIGSSLAASGDLQNALLAYQKAVELDPENPVFYRILAGFALSHQIQVRELALPAARQAVILNPQDPAALDLLGQSFYLLGDYTSADRFIHQALELNPDFPPAHLHLGMNDLLQGKMDEAYQSLLKTLLLAPGSSSADKAQRLLERFFP
jgi:tetratricopeptide (TPR) repeat protein